MKEITTVGVDLAKSVFTVHGVDGMGRPVLRKTVRRQRLMELIAGLPPCLIGMEACGGAHEWARKFQAHGHRLGIMMARFVAPYIEYIGDAGTEPGLHSEPEDTDCGAFGIGDSAKEVVGRFKTLRQELHILLPREL